MNTNANEDIKRKQAIQDRLDRIWEDQTELHILRDRLEDELRDTTLGKEEANWLKAQHFALGKALDALENQKNVIETVADDSKVIDKDDSLDSLSDTAVVIEELRKDDAELTHKLEKMIAYGTVVWHYRPIARLDVDTAKLLMSCTENDKDENRYIVQHNNGWVSNELFRKCYHWQIATPYTLEDACRIASGHRGMNEAIGDYSEVWVLRLGWAKEHLSDVMSKRWLVSTN